MSVSVTKESAESITLELTIKFNRSMLDTEAVIQTVLNKAGSLTTSKLLKQFDTDGDPIVVGSTKLTSMGLIPKVSSPNHRAWLYFGQKRARDIS